MENASGMISNTDGVAVDLPIGLFWQVNVSLK
jgi:hypothetical protein